MYFYPRTGSLMHISDISPDAAVHSCLLIIAILLIVCAVFVRRAGKLKKENRQIRFISEQTSLPNKNSLFRNIKENPSLYPLNEVTLLYVDIDNFRYINDAEGYDTGNRLLRQVSERLIALSKPKGQVYHLGEDAFAILFPNPGQRGLGEIMAAHVLAGFKISFDIDGHAYHINLSIGVVDRPSESTGFQEMLSDAEIAMYHAKESGGNRYIVYRRCLRRDFIEQYSIYNHLRHAIERHEFEICYQPQLDLAFDRIDGFEALLRWTNRDLGPVSPDQFIRAAEDTHLIVPLGNWVLRNACHFIRKLEDMGYSPLSVSVNISIIQLMQDDFVPTVQETLEFLELAPERLELEITESLLMESLDTVLPKLEELRGLGVRIALDDFGTGYSSLSYLAQIPITTLKLDKSFTDIIGSRQEGLMEGILYLCKKLNLSTVAEGVEKNSQLNYLREMGCQKMQGYLFSKPVSENEVLDLLQSAPTLFDQPFLLDTTIRS